MCKLTPGRHPPAVRTGRPVDLSTARGESNGLPSASSPQVTSQVR